MAERDSWAVMNGATRVVDAEDTRVANSALWTPGGSMAIARQGIVPRGGVPGKVQATGTPGINVTVDAFSATLTPTRGLGSYTVTLDAQKTMNVLGTDPADPSNQRNDLIIAQQSDTYYGDGSTALVVRRVKGTPSGSPSDPSVTAGGFSPDYIPLARIRVTAGATTITNAMIDDLRPGWVVALGGLLPVADATARNALAGVYEGMQIYRIDKDFVEIYDGAAWRVRSVVSVSATADITDPYTGQLVFLISAGCLYRYNGSAWFPDKGFVAEGFWNTDGVTGIAGTETVCDTKTFTNEANRRLRFDYTGSWVRSTAVGYQVFRLRYIAGTVLNSGNLASSTKIISRNLTNYTVGDWMDVNLRRSITGVPGGSVTVGLTVQRTSGSGTIEIRGDADNIRALTVEDVTGA